MSEQAHTLEIARSLGLSGGTKPVAANNLQLADQMQFSKILRHLQDTPEKTMQAAEDVVSPIDARLQRRADFKREFRDIREGDQRPDREEELISREKRSDDVKEAARPDEPVTRSPDHRPDNQPSDDGGFRVDEEGIKQSVELRGDTSDLPEAAANAAVIATAIAPAPSQPAVVAQAIVPDVTPVQRVAPDAPPAPAPQLPAQALNRGPEAALSGALTDPDFTNFADDLHRAVNRDAGENGKPSNSASAATALAGRQAQDLSHRLAATNQIFVNVEVSNEVAKPKVASPQSLTPGAELAQQVSADGDEGSFLARPNSGEGKPADAQGRGLDQQLQLGRVPPQPNANEQAMFAQQMLKAQAMAAATAQNAVTAAAQLGAKFQPVAAETIQSNPTLGPIGPSQIAQADKSNPIIAARQPAKPQAPAEQVALQIKKAVGAGADKINIKLHPESLGRVEVRLEVSRDGYIQATVLAERPDTLEMLQRDARGLERALQEAGLKTTSDSLNFGLRGDGNPRAEAQKDQGHPTGRPSERADTPEQQQDEGILTNPEVYGRNMATDGGVNIVI